MIHHCSCNICSKYSMETSLTIQAAHCIIFSPRMFWHAQSDTDLSHLPVQGGSMIPGVLVHLLYARSPSHHALLPVPVRPPSQPAGTHTHTSLSPSQSGMQLIAHGSMVAQSTTTQTACSQPLMCNMSRPCMAGFWVVLTQGLHAMQVAHGIAQACHIVSLQMTDIIAYRSRTKASFCAAVGCPLVLAQLSHSDNHASDAIYLVQSSLQVSQPCLTSV